MGKSMNDFYFSYEAFYLLPSGNIWSFKSICNIDNFYKILDNDNLILIRSNDLINEQNKKCSFINNLLFDLMKKSDHETIWEILKLKYNQTHSCYDIFEI